MKPSTRLRRVRSHPLTAAEVNNKVAHALRVLVNLGRLTVSKRRDQHVVLVREVNPAPSLFDRRP
jgi:hypothetical protein